WTLSGWAIDYAAPTTPIFVDTYLDGTEVTRSTADGARTDLTAATVAEATADHGFSVSFDAPTTVGNHYACAYAINASGAGPNPLLGCRRADLTASPVGTTGPAGSEAPTPPPPPTTTTTTANTPALPAGRIEHSMVSADKTTWTVTGWAIDD